MEIAAPLVKLSVIPSMIIFFYLLLKVIGDILPDVSLQMAALRGKSCMVPDFRVEHGIILQ